VTKANIRECDRGIKAVPTIHSHQDSVQRSVVGQLLTRVGEASSAQPCLVLAGPRSTTGIDDLLSEKQFGYPVRGAHKIASEVLTCTHQIAGGFLLRTGHRHFNDLPQMQ
jgi:hypothetical protein